MNKKLIVCLIFLFFSTKMVFCAESVKNLSSLEQKKKDAMLLKAMTGEPLDLDLAESLLGAKANPNTRDEDDRSLLHCLAFNSFESSQQRMEILLRNKADINMQDADNNTPLHLTTAAMRHSDVVTFLLKQNANPMVKNQDGYMPIHMVAKDTCLFPEVLLRLLQYNADPLAMTPAGDTVFSLTVNSSTKSTIKSIMESGINGNTFVLSCVFPNCSLIDAMIKKEADVNQQDKNGRTGLMHAVVATRCPGMEKDGIEVVKLLLHGKADTTVVASSGSTALALGGDEIKKIINNHILAEKRERTLEVLKRVLLDEEELERGYKKGIFELILGLAGTYDPIE